MVYLFLSILSAAGLVFCIHEAVVSEWKQYSRSIIGAIGCLALAVVFFILFLQRT